MFMKRAFSILVALFAMAPAFAQVSNGKLQIHHIDMGQGDAAVLVSPLGEVVLFDMGKDMANKKNCDVEVDYLDQLGVRQIDYIFISHYHSDHIGCIPAVLKKFPLKNNIFDRGNDYPGTTYQNYVAAVGDKRTTAALGQKLVLDQASPDPVMLQVYVMNATYKEGSVKSDNENDLSVGVVVTFDGFREEIAGDLSGDNTNDYQDIETPVAPLVGEIDVYKVHHHCSSHSTNDAWLKATRPTVGIISTGDGNRYGHPSEECLERLHEADLQKVYWTELGAGGSPVAGTDVIGGDIKVEVTPKASTYTVSYSDGSLDTYPIKTVSTSSTAKAAGKVTASVAPTPTYSWSIRSQYYYDSDCSAVKRISQANLKTGDTPPPDKKPAPCVKEVAPQ